MYRVQFGEEEHSLSDDMLKEVGDWDWAQIHPGDYHLLRNGQGYRVRILELDLVAKSMRLQIGNNEHELLLRDRHDLLIEKLGIADTRAQSNPEIKAPMPGKVVEVRVQAGDHIEKGQAVVILEAMKMENVIKASGPGTVSEVHVREGAAVEKNEVMISFC